MIDIDIRTSSVQSDDKHELLATPEQGTMALADDARGVQKVLRPVG